MNRLTATAALLLAALPMTARAVRAQSNGFLHTQGQNILDADNHKVMLRGVGLGNWLLPEGYMWHFQGPRADRPRRIESVISDLLGPQAAEQFWTDYRNHYIAEEDIARIAALGFNSVRVPLNARLFLTEGEHPQFRDEGFKRLDDLITWCREKHLWVIIDMHAAPGGQTGQNIDDSIDDDPGLWSKPENQTRLQNLWLKIATKYANDPTVAAYDLLNEPLPKRTGAADKYSAQLEPLYKRLTTAIRTVDTHHMITVEGYDWANNWSCFTAPPFDDNLVYQFHYYCWDKPTQLKPITTYLNHRDRLNAPVWVGETGEKDPAIYWATTAELEHANIGWCFWPWKKLDATNAPYSIPAPQGWPKITRYARTLASEDKPPRDQAQQILDQYLHNIRLENCTYYQDVPNALFHRAPVKLEAENYIPTGPDHAYHVHEPATQATLYRKSDPVPIVPTDDNGTAGQAIHLAQGEWTAYTLNSETSKTYTATIKLKPDHAPTTVTLTINGTPHTATANTDDWSELSLGPIPLTAGPNTLKLSVDSPAAIDWVEIN